jgi:hypothetical protein
MKRQIRAKEALEDIRGGMPDGALMMKYRINALGLQSLYRKLVASGLLSRSELDERQSPYAGTVALDTEDLQERT